MQSLSPYNILQVVASLKGGAAEHLLLLSQGLIQKGHRLEIISPGDNPDQLEQINQLGIQHHSIPLNSASLFKSIFRLRKLIRLGLYTHIHVHGHRAAFVIRLAYLCAWNKPELIYTVHGYHPAHYSKFFERWIGNGVEWILSPLIAAFICVSASTREELLKSVPGVASRCKVLENGILINSFNEETRLESRRELRNHMNIPENTFVLGTIARLQWQKGIDRLIEATEELSHHYDDLALVIVGDGPEKDKLKNLAANLHSADLCIFAGHKKNARQYLSMFDLFVLPSLWEGLPLTVLEAWDAGIPVVVTDVPGSRDLVKDEITGWIAENSVQGIVDAVQHARKSEILSSIIQNAHQKLIRHFSAERMVERTEKVYEKVLLERSEF